MYVSVVHQNLKQSDIAKTSGDYPIYGAFGIYRKIQIFIHSRKSPYVAVVKDGAGVGRALISCEFISNRNNAVSLAKR